MLKGLRRLLSRRQGRRANNMGATREDRLDNRQQRSAEDDRDDSLSPRLSINTERIREAFGDSHDLQIRHLRAGQDGRTPVLVVSIDGLSQKEYLTKSVLLPITNTRLSWSNPQEAFEDIKEHLLGVSHVTETDTLEPIMAAVASGDSVLMVQGVARALICSTRGWAQRDVQEPGSEQTIRGPKEAFVENLRTNTALIRRRIRSPRLRIEERKLGRVSQTIVALVYIEGLASESVLQEVRERLDRVDVDALGGSGHLEEYIGDAWYSPFPTWLLTERPDRSVSFLLEGRILLMMDGDPDVIAAPTTLTMFLTSADDYLAPSYLATFLRLLRFGGFFLSLTLPSIYVALTTFHQEMLPTTLILGIAAQREGVPVPALVEALAMELTFEALREAGLRLPRAIGSAISIIGALILGDAAIRAGLVSPFMVVIVAATGIASFTTPVSSFSPSIRLLRFGMILVAGALGLFGVIAGLFALLLHLSCVRSLGVPYLEPLAPVVVSDLKDAIIRVPWWKMDTRPRLLGQGGTRRQARHLKPEPPPREE